MERIFERRSRLVSEQVSFSASIYEREEGDGRPQAVQVCFDLAGVAGVQSGMTFYVADPVELHALAEQFKHAAVALTYAQKFEAKNEAEAAWCGRINSGHSCTMPAGSKCPDCGPSCHEVGEGD